MTTKLPANLLEKRRRYLPKITILGLVVVMVFGLFTVTNQRSNAVKAFKDDETVEPLAGTWQTWVLESGNQLRPAPPPANKETREEMRVLEELASQRDATALEQIAYWNSGSPEYRWNEIAIDAAFDANLAGMRAERLLALLNVAMYDATVAAWDAKYEYDRARPSQFIPAFETVIPNPDSPSYPSEHAVVAGAASEVLAFLFPENADTFRNKAEEAGRAFLLAGVQYPSDVATGLELGRQVAALVIEQAKADNSNAQWDGSMPSGQCKWTGSNPVAPAAGQWETWVLTSGAEFRPDPPIDCTSSEMEAEMAELRTYPRGSSMNTTVAYFNEYGTGATRGYWFWNQELGNKIFEYNLVDNSPRAARAYALLYITRYDSNIACFDAKYAYWAIRPFQLDPDFQPLFPTPNHPTYPAAHACVSGATADIMSYLFPQDTESFQAEAQDAGESRLWAGIHFRSDVEVGFTLAHNVAQKVIEHAQNDGSQ
jgi:hypothetical protein